MDSTAISFLAQWIGGGAVGLIVLAFSIQKLWSSARETTATTAIIQLLRDEIEHSSKTNKILREEVVALQTQIVVLRRLVNDLNVENFKLKSEVHALNDRISTLNQTIEAYKLGRL